MEGLESLRGLTYRKANRKIKFAIGRPTPTRYSGSRGIRGFRFRSACLSPFGDLSVQSRLRPSIQLQPENRFWIGHAILLADRDGAEQPMATPFREESE